MALVTLMDDLHWEIGRENVSLFFVRLHCSICYHRPWYLSGEAVSVGDAGYHALVVPLLPDQLIPEDAAGGFLDP